MEERRGWLTLTPALARSSIFHHRDLDSPAKSVFYKLQRFTWLSALMNYLCRKTIWKREHCVFNLSEPCYICCKALQMEAWSQTERDTSMGAGWR